MGKFLVPVASRYSSVVVQFGVVAVVTRSLSPDDAGNYFLVMGLVWATYFAAGIGLPDGAVRFVPTLSATRNTVQARLLLNRAFLYSLASVPIGAASIICIVGLYHKQWGIAILAGIWWASYGVIFISAQRIVAQGYSDLGTAMFYSAANAGQLVITVPLILVGQLSTLEAVLTATVIGVSAAAVACLALTGLRGERRPTPGGREGIPLRETWRQGATIAAGRVVQASVIWSPVWVAGLTLSESDAALVGISTRIVSAVAAVIAAVRFSIRPALARDAALGNWRRIEIQSSRIALYTTGLAICAITTAAAVGKPIIAWAFGHDYRAAAWISALMLIGTVGESLGGPVDEILRMSGDAVNVLVVQIAALSVGIGVQFLAAHAGGIKYLALTYSLIFVAYYLTLIARLWHLRGILVLPRLLKEDPD